MTKQRTNGSAGRAGGGAPAAADENKLVAERRAKLQRLRAAGGAYPNDARRTAKAADLQADYAAADKAGLAAAGREFAVCGRLIRDRGAFLLLQDGSGEMQLYVNREALEEDELARIKDWDLGDIVWARGPLHRSGKGELYINMHAARLLVKALRPLPDKFHGLTDHELRHRQRYADLIANRESKAVFILRSRIVDAARRFMQEHEFMEVETPMMHPIPGGAAARPFATHHHALDMDMYLRIAPELYLKRLTVGGFEKVFEINRSFRNEGVSTQHNPEFTMLEFYWAYADFHDAMGLVEAMLRAVAAESLQSAAVTYQGDNYDLAPPFARMTLIESIQRFNPELEAAAISDESQARAAAKQLGIPLQQHWGLGKIQLEIFEHAVEHKLLQPTFITEYPAEVSPLSRRNDKNPRLADRFELFIAGRELANGFSELNDPEDQAERFRAQAAAKDAGDLEAMHFDADYIAALEYGMPPAAGVGIGIDRLVMFLADCASIRDVLLFPHLRPESRS